MKIHLSGSHPSIRVPVREISLSNGESLRLYDTSGPYTAPGFTPDPKQGLPALRRPWILERGDVEPGAGGRWGLRARPGRRVTQRHYARRGEITPEMEVVALRGGLPPPAGRGGEGGGAPHPPRQHQPPRDGAHDHRAPLSREDQRQYRQLGRDLLHRGGDRKSTRLNSSH